MRTGSGCLALLFAAAAFGGADPKIKIASVSAEYTPPLSFYAKPVWVAYHHFEVDPKTEVVRIVVEYQFPFQSLDAYLNGALGPDDTETEVPGLTWDAASREVVFESGGTRTVCAEVPQGAHNIKPKNTKSCKVTDTERDRLPSDVGIQSDKVLDVWLEAN